MKKLPKSYNPMTEKQKGEIWAYIIGTASKLYYDGAIEENLKVINDCIVDLNKFSKRLQKTQVGEALASIK